MRTGGALILLVLLACGTSQRRAQPKVGRSAAPEAGAASTAAPPRPAEPREPDLGGESSGGYGFAGHGEIGVRHYGPIGHGTGTGSGYGVGCREEDGCRPRGRGRYPRVELEGMTVTGDLDASLVRRPVYAQLISIQGCYVDRLEARPELAGVLVASFAIARNGTVIHVTASGIGDRVVEACVEAVIRAIRFTPRDSGGVVNVTDCRFTLRQDQ